MRQEGYSAVEKNIEKINTYGIPEHKMENHITKNAIEKSRQKWADRKGIKPLYGEEGIAVHWPTMKPKPPCITFLMDPICEDRTDKDWLEFPEYLSTGAFDALSCAEVETTMLLLRASYPVTRRLPGE